MEEKKGVDIDAADVVKEALGGLSNIVPILQNNTRGSIFALALIGMISSTAIAIMLLSKQPFEAQKKVEPQKIDDSINKIDGDESGGNIYQIKS